MRLLSFVIPDNPRQIRLGAFLNDCCVDLACARTWTQGACHLPGEDLPQSLPELVHSATNSLPYIAQVLACLEKEDPAELKGSHRARVGYHLQEVALLPPLIHPVSLRNFHSFEAHVQNVFALLQRPIPEEWYLFPIYDYSNVNAIFGPGVEINQPSFTSELDFELQVACVIGKFGKNIPIDQVDQYICGYTILNNWTARDLQRQEMAVGLGQARARDFATSIGPYLVTPDELSDCHTGRQGAYDLQIPARVNGVEMGRGNWKDMHFSFGEMIAQASIDTYLVPGDVIASGTVTTGSLLDTTQGKGPWLKIGDRIEVEIERLGILDNTIAVKHLPANN